MREPLMDENEIIARRAVYLCRIDSLIVQANTPGHPQAGCDGGGEYGELTIELAASLAAHNTPVTPEERDELRALLEAMDMATDPIGQLNVQS